MFKKLLIFSFLTLVFSTSFSQEIPSSRQSFHDKIIEARQKILRLDGKDDNFYAGTSIPQVNRHISHLLVDTLNRLITKIEKDDSLDNNNKIKYLRGIGEVLNGYYNYFRIGAVQPVQLLHILRAFNRAVNMEMKGISFISVIENNEPEVGQVLVNNFIFQNDENLNRAKDLIVYKQCIRQPDRTMQLLSLNPDNFYADTLIKKFARYNPEELYNYAAAFNALAKKIAKVDDALVKYISQMSQMKAGRQYFPFLDNLYRGKITIEQIDNATDNKINYFKLLVATQIDYAGRLRNGDTPLIMETLTNRLKQKTVEIFINEINGLHEQPNSIRFKILDQLTAPELYYIGILGETEMYTSSYVNGIYPKMIDKMKMQRSDSLLANVHYDHFKKFIRVAANFNTLNDFLKRMDKEKAIALMTDFVNNLDKTASLEDAVDVADSYGSIKDKELSALMMKEVNNNYEKATSQKARTIYGILSTLFKSKENNNDGKEMFEKLGIPPVYYMPNNMLRDSSGKIVIQQFFYGDEDGKIVFDAFIRQFRSLGWRMTSNPQWVLMSWQGKGIPVHIYSNRPLDTEQDLDEKAQAALSAYLESKNMQPTVIIHRGHSYYTDATIRQIPETAKVVFLGSCGGYNNLNDVLNICPTAHIISTKQVGSGVINLPLINTMAEELRKGENLNWPAIWSRLSKKLKHNESFEDYIPPHKNLGAIFIMAYHRAEENMF